MTICNVIVLMSIAGVFGGGVNFALARTDKSTLLDAFWSVVKGLAAAFLVPLFLNTISSSLLSDILSGNAPKSDGFVFFGFCLLGAIASDSMIQSLTKQALGMAKDAKTAAEAAKSKVDKLEEETKPMVLKGTEPEIADENGGLSFRMEGYGTDDDARKIIKALGNSKYSRRTIQGIQKESLVPHEKVIEVLDWLRKHEMCVTGAEPYNYWSLTEKGLRTFNNIEHS